MRTNWVPSTPNEENKALIGFVRPKTRPKPLRNDRHRPTAAIKRTHDPNPPHSGHRGPAQRRLTALQGSATPSWATTRHPPRPPARPHRLPWAALRVDRYRRHRGGRFRVHPQPDPEAPPMVVGE